MIFYPLTILVYKYPLERTLEAFTTCRICILVEQHNIEKRERGVSEHKKGSLFVFSPNSTIERKKEAPLLSSTTTTNYRVQTANAAV